MKNKEKQGYYVIPKRIITNLVRENNFAIDYTTASAVKEHENIHLKELGKRELLNFIKLKSTIVQTIN